MGSDKQEIWPDIPVMSHTGREADLGCFMLRKFQRILSRNNSTWDEERQMQRYLFSCNSSRLLSAAEISISEAETPNRNEVCPQWYSDSSNHSLNSSCPYRG